jgi:hypothetical protein
MANSDMAWAKVDAAHVPPEIDTTKPTVARVYDAILGGKDNFAADRAVAAQAVKATGDGGKGARLNRAALGRAVRFMCRQGVAQFLDLGSGLPTAQNTHQIAQAVNPAARVVYVDNDRSAYVHGQALLTGDASTVVVLADIREPDKLLARLVSANKKARLVSANKKARLVSANKKAELGSDATEAAGFLDFAQPIGLILNAVIHHVLDEEDPYGIVARYKDALAPGSYLQLTHFCDSSPEARANEQVLKKSLGRGQIRSREQIARFFDGLDLVEPGLVYLPEWRPDEPVRRPLDPGSMLMLGGVGRKP